jgi:membrane protease YdiL (CAAX protease family)
LASPLWAGWFAALTFAFVHGDPTVAHLIAGRIGLPLGPFLLGLCCEALVEATGRLAPAIAFHGACNATVAIFALADGRWLDWLGFLYS